MKLFWIAIGILIIGYQLGLSSQKETVYQGKTAKQWEQLVKDKNIEITNNKNTIDYCEKEKDACIKDPKSVGCNPFNEYLYPSPTIAR